MGTFNRVIDSVTRMRCWSLMLTAAFTFVDNCAVFVAVDGWLAGCAAVFALSLAGACWARLLAGGCCGWPVAGVVVLVCASTGTCRSEMRERWFAPAERRWRCWQPKSLKLTSSGLL
jgi:hypothetical protein